MKNSRMKDIIVLDRLDVDSDFLYNLFGIELLTDLLDIIGEKDLNGWLKSGNDYFDGKSPLEVVRDKGIDPLVELISGVKVGQYL